MRPGERRLALVAIAMTIVLTGVAAEKDGLVKVSSSGVTTVRLAATSAVQARLTSKSTTLKALPAGATYDPMSSCTYTRDPCSLVERLEIVVGGKSLFVPRSVFSDLADVNTAQLSQAGNEYHLALDFGDGLAGYKVIVHFDTERIIRRSVGSLDDPKQISQETNYREIVID